MAAHEPLEPSTGPCGTPPAQGTKAQHANTEEGQRARLWGGSYRGEQPVRLTVDPVGNIEGVGVTIQPTDPKVESPQTTRSVAAAGVDRDRTEQRSGRGVESVDLTVEKAEVAYQQVAAKLAETGRRQRDAPRCGKLAADDRLLQVAALIENRHGSHPGGGPSLGCKPGGRVGYVDLAGDVLHVERDQP